MRYFSLGIICDSLDEINDIVYPFHNEFIGYYPKQYFDINIKEKRYLKFESYSREIEDEWALMSANEKEIFRNDIIRFADVKYGYYYNDEKSDIGYYKNENGKIMCFSIGGRFKGLIKVKNALGISKKVEYAKVKDIIIPDVKEKFGTYAVIDNGKWISVEDYENRDEWFYIHFRRLLRKANREKLFVIVECCYNKNDDVDYTKRSNKYAIN